MMRIIPQSDVERLLPVGDCVDVMAEAMRQVSARNVHLPIRQFMPVAGAPGKMAIMPGSLGEVGKDDDANFGIKLVCKYERPHDDPLGTHVGMVLLFDSERGIPLAMLEGSSLTSVRTSAASALATRELARENATDLAIIGNGEQAMRHVHAMRAVRPIEQVTVWGRDPQRASDFAADVTLQTNLPCRVASSPEDCVAGADIVCTTTSAKEPILPGSALEPGQHINLVGSAIPTTAEVDDEAVKRSRFYVDYREAAMAAAGELLKAIESGAVTEAHIVGEIGEVVTGTVSGRQSPDEITMYKSLGVSAQDLAAGHAIWRMAQKEGAGIEVDLLA